MPNVLKTPQNTIQKREASTIPIVGADVFVRDLQKLRFLYPIDILQTETRLVRDILSPDYYHKRYKIPKAVE